MSLSLVIEKNSYKRIMLETRIIAQGSEDILRTNNGITLKVQYDIGDQAK